MHLLHDQTGSVHHSLHHLLVLHPLSSAAALPRAKHQHQQIITNYVSVEGTAIERVHSFVQLSIRLFPRYLLTD